MTDNTKKQLKWFTKKLLEIRSSNVDGFGQPIPLTLSEVENCTVVDFDIAKGGKWYVEKFIEEIRDFTFTEDSKHRRDIITKYSSDDLSVEIFGIGSNLLRSFIKTRLGDLTSLIETGANGHLLYIGADTGIIINPAEKILLSKLIKLKESGDILSYADIFEICAICKGQEQKSYRTGKNTTKKMNVAARGLVSDLLKKMKSSPQFRNLDIDNIIINVRNKGYKLII